MDFADQFNRGLIRPLIRITKYWNALQDYPYHPIQIEEAIVNRGYQFCGGMFSTPDLFDYVYDFLGQQPVDTPHHWRKPPTLSRTKMLLARAKRLEAGGRKFSSAKCLAKILPPLKPALSQPAPRRARN
ncbi:MAG: hypothetical protein AABY83_14365 [Pseudomonadota bacterium]